MEDIIKLFGEFEALVISARANKIHKKDMGDKLAEVLRVSNKSKKELAIFLKESIDRTTVDRWLSGLSVPHASSIVLIRKFFIDTEPCFSQFHLLIAFLTTPSYRPIFDFFQKNPSGLNAEQLESLIKVADMSKGVMTEEMIRTVLGL